jgi:hypothetical protein
MEGLMVTREQGERRVKAMQREMLCWVEEHEVYGRLDPETLNMVRHRIIRSTFDAYRLGIVGLPAGEDAGSRHWVRFAGWVGQVAGLSILPAERSAELMGRCFAVSLTAFRIGALVAGAEAE